MLNGHSSSSSMLFGQKNRRRLDLHRIFFLGRHVIVKLLRRMFPLEFVHFY